MYISGQTLRTSADFDNAMLFELNVEVWQDGHILNYGGIIDKVTENTVRINDAYYFISVCAFKVR
jgi:hypothetical protein